MAQAPFCWGLCVLLLCWRGKHFETQFTKTSGSEFVDRERGHRVLRKNLENVITTK